MSSAARIDGKLAAAPIEPDAPGADGGTSPADIPLEFLRFERAIIERRRHRVAQDRHAAPPRDSIVGLALSGRGVRSATFSLGVLQALAANGVLRKLDYLSTVSGGGYIGAFLGRFYTRFVNRPDGALEVIERRLADVNSPEIAWLRRSSEYVAAVGIGESPVTTAVILRSFLTVHFIIGLLLVAAFNVANIVRHGVFPQLVGWINPMLANVTRQSQPVQVFFPDPWLSLLIAVLVLALIPLAVAYWLPSNSDAESYEPAPFIAFIVAAAAGFVTALASGAWLVAAGVFVATGAVFFCVERAWSSISARVPGATTHPTGRAMVRSQLSKWLGVAVSVAAALLAVWTLDRMVLDRYDSVPTRRVVELFALSFVLLLLPLRWLALWLFAGNSARGLGREIRWRILTSPFLLPVLLGIPVLVGWSYISRVMFRDGADVEAGTIWTVLTVVVSALLGSRAGIDIVNRSSAQSLLAARGSRAYLGASNPYRHTTEVGGDLTVPQPEDDIAFERYRPDLAGGPIHIINVFVNQSIDRESGRRTRDRQGDNMAIGPRGVSIGAASHAVWVHGGSPGDAQPWLRAVESTDLPAPFVPRVGPHAADAGGIVQTSRMRLSDWMAVSGATFTPGTYGGTRLGTSLLYGLSNVRAGFWWDSGIEDGSRAGEPVTAWIWRPIRWVKRRFRAQQLLLAEFTGRYAGPWRRYWYLSDGGHADDLAVYELVRRRVPIIICVDATQDADGGVAALAVMTRKVRVDFAASVEFLSTEELCAVAATLERESRPLPATLTRALGTLDDVRSTPNANSRTHAAIARIRYDGTREPGVLLYVKPTITGDEPVDVFEYRRQHPRFPHQSVLNQSLDEAQWESYRELGLHCATPLFADGIRWLSAVREVLATSVAASSSV